MRQREPTPLWDRLTLRLLGTATDPSSLQTSKYIIGPIPLCLYPELYFHGPDRHEMYMAPVLTAAYSGRGKKKSLS